MSGTEVTAMRGAATLRANPDPIAAVDVLVPLAERDALLASREGGWVRRSWTAQDLDDE